MPATASLSTGKRIAIVAPSTRALREATGNFIDCLLAARHSLLILTDAEHAPVDNEFRAGGAVVTAIAHRPEGFSLWPARQDVQVLAKQIALFDPHAVLACGAALLPRALTAAKQARVARIAAVLDDASAGKMPVSLTRALRAAHVIVAHNRETVRALASAGLNSTTRSVVQLPGAGADLSAIQALPLPALDQPLVFMFAGPLSDSSGVTEFCEAARVIRLERLPAKFVVVRTPSVEKMPETSPLFVPSADNLTIVGDGADLSQLIASAHVFVAPSHAEAMPYYAIQALASGRPLIVSNTAGKREATDEMVNGMLVPAGDAAALADAIRRMISHRDLLPAMARASRLKAERHFSSIGVHAALNAALGLA
jgi:glycosyltransferase involved in cell wall biosynthesis